MIIAPRRAHLSATKPHIQLARKVARLAARSHREQPRMATICGFFRPMRSPSQPEAVAPERCIDKVIVTMDVTEIMDTPKCCEIKCMISRKTVKSNASRVPPSQAAMKAYHCALVASLYHGSVAPADDGGPDASLAVATYSLPLCAWHGAQRRFSIS